MGEARIDLNLESLRFSNPVPEEGEEIIVEAVIRNFGESCRFDAVFYWAPEIILSDRQIEEYTNPEYEIYRKNVKIPSGGKVAIQFRWKVKKGFACMFVKPEKVEFFDSWNEFNKSNQNLEKAQ
ncbi:MAG: hypothetical protein DSY33_02410 [Archaeoglobus sp.]|nr:MAG: hypothetical protein DSY33_02410 [Archaeoglobus sp.]